VSVIDGPIESLKKAIIGVLSEDPEIPAARLFYQEVKAGVDLPAGRINFHGDVPTYVLSPEEAYRTFIVSVEWCAEEAGGVSGAMLASRLNERTHGRLVETMSFTVGEGGDAVEYENELPQTRINRFLEPEGYSSMIPLEQGAILPYPDGIGKDKDVKRWCVGYFYHLRIQRL